MADGANDIVDVNKLLEQLETQKGLACCSPLKRNEGAQAGFMPRLTEVLTRQAVVRTLWTICLCVRCFQYFLKQYVHDCRDTWKITNSNPSSLYWVKSSKMKLSCRQQ
jgi:hypothetical protein